MYVEIKDLQTGTSHRIEGEGATLGRDPGRCDVVLSERGVSSVHARVYAQGTRWLIEDLKSSNGTYVADRRITGATALERGGTFALYNYRFEVTDMAADTASEATALFDAGEQPPADDGRTQVSPAPVYAPAPTVTARAAAVQAAAAQAAAAQAATAQAATAQAAPVAAPSAAGPKPSTTRASAAESQHPVSPRAAEQGQGGAAADAQAAFGATLRRALAYYPAAVPRLVMGPVAATRQLIDEQPFAPMKFLDLFAWGLPVFLLGTLISVLATVAVGAASGVFSVALIGVPLVMGVVVNSVVALIVALIWHPVLDWLTRVLKGQSTDKSRTNMFIALCTAMPVTYLASAIAVLFVLIPLPFVTALPQLLSLAATILTLYIAYNWYQHFGVVKWWLTLIIVVGGLLAALTVWNMVGITRAGIARLSAPSTPTEATAALEQAAAALQEQAAKAGIEGAAASKEATGAAAAAAAAGIKAAEAGMQAAAKAMQEASKQAAQTEVGGGAQASNGSGPSSYQEFLRRRAAIEQAIDSDPSLLTRIKGVLPLYKKLHKETDKVQDKHAPKRGKAPTDDKVAERLRQAEVYEATVAIVDELHALLNKH